MTRFFSSRSRAAAALVAALALFSAVPAYAQTVLNSTTLAAAITTADQRTVSLTSATGVTAPGNGSTLVYLLVDRELMQVTGITSTVATVVRGASATRATTHISGAALWVAPPQAIYAQIPSGQCTRTNLLYVPYVVGGAPGLGAETGMLFDCLGVTTAGQWVQTNGNGIAVFGSTVVSANTIAPTGTYFKTSGTTVIKTITLPAGAAAGFSITVEATGVDTWDATGNILTAGTFTAAGHTVMFTWNGAKWVPDKVA
jgi:hypothetical protein